MGILSSWKRRTNSARERGVELNGNSYRTDSSENEQFGRSIATTLLAIILPLSLLSTPAKADEVLRLYRKAEARLELAVDHGRRCKHEIKVTGKEQDDCDAFAGAAVGWRNASRELKEKVNMDSVRLLGQLDKGDIGNYKRLLDELDSILEYLDAHREAGK